MINFHVEKIFIGTTPYHRGLTLIVRMHFRKINFIAAVDYIERKYEITVICSVFLSSFTAVVLAHGRTIV